MLVELGNHKPLFAGADEHLVTAVTIPEFDAEFRKHTNHYGHKPIKVSEFRDHRQGQIEFNQGITQLPDHEALLSIVNAWPQRGSGKPAWVKVTDHGAGLTPKGQSKDIEKFLSEYYECPTLEGFYGDIDTDEAHIRKELSYWTVNGRPGEARSLVLPDIQNTYMVDGRIMNNLNDGGDALQSLMMGTGSAATGTTLTTSNTLVTNATAGHRVYVYTTSGNVFVWGNCISNTNAASASVITVDQWYVPLTPGGSVGSNPGTPWAWVIVDGGMVSTWFAAMATGANAPVNTDHTLATNGNTEYTQAGGTLIRKICPTATDVSSSARTVTLVPVFTANASDVANLPKVFTTIGFFASMVPGFGGAGGPMKYETALSASATVNALSDQVTITETIQGS